MHLDRITYKGIAITLFLFLFGYLCLRAVYVEPLHDELATFYFYIYHGDYAGQFEVFDANNHLLNSFLGHYIYKVVGDNWFFLRLPNMLAFGLYALGLYKLINRFANKWNKILVFAGILSIPFIFEYFAYSRGYGLSMGFFLCGLAALVTFFENGKQVKLWLVFFFMILAVASNLTFVTMSILLIGYLIVYVLTSKAYRLFLPILIFVLTLIPFLLFGLTLKEKGALYYGSLDGIWDVTGESLVEYTLFFKGIGGMLLILLLLLFIVGYVIQQVLNVKINVLIKEPIVVVSTLLIGSLLAIYLLAMIMHVNYPSDRTAMYLVPLILLAFGGIVDKLNWNFLNLSFLFFPVSFMLHISLSTSVFSPDDRMPQEFYDAVKKQLKDTDNLMIYNTMGWNWPYKESKSFFKASNPIKYQPDKAFTDVVLTKTTLMNEHPEIYSDYDTIAYDKESTYIGLKRRKTAVKNQFDAFEIEEIFGDWEYITVTEQKDFGNWPKDKPIQFTVTGVLETFDENHYAIMVLQTFDKSGNQIGYEYYPFDAYYHGRKINDKFRLNYIIEKLPENTGEIKLYLWNKGLNALLLKQVKCYLYEVNYPEHGIR